MGEKRSWGDFNDIRSPEEKRRWRLRSTASCKEFKDFKEKIHMEEIKH